MGKKTEKGSKDKNVVGSNDDDSKNSAVGLLDKTLLSPEDYQCTGNLDEDFTELCCRVGYTEIPKIIACSNPPGTPASEKTSMDESEWNADGQAGSVHNAERFSYFRPKIRVELESEDAKSVKEVSVRGWKIDDKMMGVFAKCLPALTDLHAISLWNVALTDNTFSSFVSILQQCPNLRVVTLEGNPLPDQSYYKLITDDLPLTHVSLRNNKIDDEGARLLSQALQNLKLTNKNLASLNLGYNHISDVGACHIAEALRLNRSLLSLNLSSNRIGDKGALALAEILGHFALNHKEILERRRLLLEKESQEHPRSPGTSRHGDPKSDRPQSHQSNNVSDKTQVAKTSKSTVKKKEKEKDPPRKEEKSVTSTQPSGTSSQTGAVKKEDAKPPKKQLANPDPKNQRGKGVKSATKRVPLTEQEQTEPTEVTNPLLEPTESQDGKIFLPGNKVLINLNLLRNRISEEGLKGFLAAIETQVVESKPVPGTKIQTGLLRLSIARNNFSPTSPTFIKLQEIMFTRDPMNKSSATSVEDHIA
ncbi:leucine-rich repeat-containing protein 71 [Spea bombifrons]|uniref:leucine-rich repeat-containing protein 71 n=1 Tax=Spea bombifrons TaxID=233779 RepID=UPI00234B7D0F|nr:leucine-rich repeat-containing protein 71 [Spea bombifrons]